MQRVNACSILLVDVRVFAGRIKNELSNLPRVPKNSISNDFDGVRLTHPRFAEQGSPIRRFPSDHIIKIYVNWYGKLPMRWGRLRILKLPYDKWNRRDDKTID